MMCFESSWARTPCSSGLPQPPEAEAVHEAVVEAEAEVWPEGKDQLTPSRPQQHRQQETCSKEKLKQDATPREPRLSHR